MATTPELYEPQIAAARAQAWHQVTPPATPQAEATPQTQVTPQAETTPEAEITPKIEVETESVEEGTSSEPSPSPTPTDLTPTSSTAPSPTATGRILTLEAARKFVSDFGLVLFSPRSLGAPAPSLVEATLGETKASVTAAESEMARALVSRLVAEGSALPLNLLGGPGDMPDFIVSTAAFPFVFTLRGDKGWKRAPETVGAVKVTTLALHVYEVLAEKAPLTVAEIVTEVGREITESAVTRSLSELWALLRVIPSLQLGEGATRWELTTTRFLKAVKAGANAGQPTALSALISLYLGQAYLATEEEICAFLSPLTARSRVRDVLHGLSAGRQLSEAVLEGKTILYLPDSLPDFAAASEPTNTFSRAFGRGLNSFAGEQNSEHSEDSEGAPVSEGTQGSASATGSAEGESNSPSQPTERIRRFEGGAEAGRDRSLRGKPIARPDTRPDARSGGFRSAPPRPGNRFSAGSGSGPRPSRPAPRDDDRQSRPYPERRDRPSAGGSPREGAGERPSFARPWDEEKRDRPARPEGDRPARPAFGAKPPFGTRPAFGAKPPFGARPSFGAKPSFGARDSRPPRREGGPDRPAFGNRERPSFGSQNRPPFRREGGGEAPPFRRREEGGGPSRPFRSSFSPGGGSGAGAGEPRGEGRPPRRDSASGGFFPRRENREGGSSDRPRPFRPVGDRPSGDRPSASFGPRNFDRPARDDGAGRPAGGGFRPREEGAGRPFGDRPPRPADRGGEGRPPFRPAGGGRPFGDRPARPFGDRPARPSGDRPARPFGDRPARPFNDRPARDGETPRSRPSGGFGDRGGSGDRGGFRPGGAGGGFKRAPGGFSRGPARGAEGDRPAPRRRPEDEA